MKENWRQEIDITTSAWRVLESFSTELGELVPQSVACLVSMPHFGLDVISSNLKSITSGERGRATPKEL